MDEKETPAAHKLIIEALEKKLRKYQELDLIKRQLLGQEDTGRLLDMLAEAAARLINAETVAIPMLSADSRQVRYDHAWGRHMGAFKGISMPIEKAGLCGWVLENRRPILTNHLRDDPRVIKETAAALGINSAALSPLISRGRIIGGLSAFNRAGGGGFTEEDLADLMGLADYAALIIDGATLMEELSKEKLKLDAIFDGVDDGIIFISKEGIIQKANAAAGKYLPIGAEDLVGASVHDLSEMGRLGEIFNWDAKAEPGDRCYEVLCCKNPSCLMRKMDLLRCWLLSDGSCDVGCQGGGEGREGLEFCSDCEVLKRAFRQLSRPREVSIMGKTLQVTSRIAHDRKDKVFGEIMVLHDVTAEKDIERQRMELISMVTHDLKAPLTSVIGFCNLISEEKDLAKVQGMIQVQHESSLWLLEMIDSFLDLKKIEAGYMMVDIRPVEVGPLLETLARRFRAQAELNNIGLSYVMREGVKAVMADAECLRRVLENLVSNSVKFAGQGRSVQITASMRGKSVEVAVADDGPGIPEGDIGRLFQKYFTSGKNAAGRGSGLGLAIAKELTEAQGGSIRVVSEEGKGTAFFVTLPAAP